MGIIKDMYDINTKVFQIATIVLLLFFPLNWIDGFINVIIFSFIGIANFIYEILIGIINFMLSFITGLLEGLINTISTTLNGLIPFGDPFGTVTFSYQTIPYSPIAYTPVDIFPDKSLFGFLWEGFGGTLPI